MKVVLAKSAKIAPDSICRHSELRSAANAKSVADSCKRGQVAAMKSLERTSTVICALQNHTRNAMTSEMIIAKVHDKPQRHIKKLHVRQELHPKLLKITSLNGFRLDDKTVINEQIAPKLLVKGRTQIRDCHNLLAFDLVSGNPQRLLKRFDVNRLKKSVTKMTMNRNSGINDNLGEFVGLLVFRMHVCAIFAPKCIKYAVLGLPRTAPQTPRRYSAERRRFELFATSRILRELDTLASTRKGGGR